MEINLPSSKPQANVAARLEQIRNVYLQEALKSAVLSCDLGTIDEELREVAPEPELKALAAAGLRGELLFATPVLLRKKPSLIAYYRLLLGYSQKEFFHKAKLGRFKLMESKGVLSPRINDEIPDLCRALSKRASDMFAEIGFEKATPTLLHELTLLTFGPQLQGSRNTEIGKIANRAVFEIIHAIVRHAVIQSSDTEVVLTNASGRTVVIAFSADPDISIFEELGHGKRRVVAIEVKGGADQSNIWNRLGEAEKSHQSAKARGFVAFWTIYNLPRLDLAKANEKSPTTQRFYSLVDLSDESSTGFADFREQLLSLVGIRGL